MVAQPSPAYLAEKQGALQLIIDVFDAQVPLRRLLSIEEFRR